MNNTLSTFEKRIEDLFGTEPFDTVSEELFTWLLFYHSNGSNIKNLNIQELEDFKAKLNQLIDAIYNWHLRQ